MRPQMGWAVLAAALLGAVCAPQSAHAQPSTPPAGTREGEIVAQQVEKARSLHPPRPGRAEALVIKLDQFLVSGHMHWHPYFGTAYQGAGFTLGAGYAWHLGDYNTLDLRGGLSLSGSRRAEAEFRMPRLFRRRAVLTTLADWREGVDQSFFGLGSAGTSVKDRTRFDFRQALLSGALEARPTRGAWVVGSGVQYSRTEQLTDAGSAFAQRYTPDALPGVGATVNYLHTHGTMGVDWRRARGYARSGGYYGITARRFDDTEGGGYSFRQIEYEAVQHLPVLRDAWALSLRGHVVTTHIGDEQAVPFFMLPALGDGATLRGFTSWRFRDRNSLLLSAEWRVLVNAFSDVAFFYDTGKVTARRGDLDLRGLKGNYGIGFRLHTLSATPFRIDLARSNEGFVLVFGSSAAF